MILMRPWVALYAMIWIVFVEFLLAMTPHAPSWVLWAHVALGVGIVALAFSNAASVRATRVPGRVKRIAQSTMQLSIVLALLGVPLVLRWGADLAWLGVSLYGAILFLHVVLAIAVLTQAAAVAISFDMWEEKEFAAETEPGDVPAMPAPPAATGPRQRAH